MIWRFASVILIGLVAGCSQEPENAGSTVPTPQEIIDLGALVTADLPERVWGTRYLAERGWARPNVFDVMPWQAGPVNASNSYYTFFNHGGPHVDGPNHIGLPGGLDVYPVSSFAGPLRVFDVSHLGFGRTVTKGFFEGQGIRIGDVVMIYTNYRPPETENDYPKTITLTREEYLANIPPNHLILSNSFLSITVSCLAPGEHSYPRLRNGFI